MNNNQHSLPLCLVNAFRKTFWLWLFFFSQFVITQAALQTAIESDDFDRSNLDLSRWTFINPLDDGWISMTGTNTLDAYLELSVPAGQTHDPWQALNRSVRAMQSAPDTDFEVEVKFDSEPDPNQAFQLQGIIIEESNNNWLRFDLNSNGTSLRIFAASTVNGTSSQKINGVVNPGDANYLKVNRLGNTWTLAYSGDGSAWTTAGSFAHTMVVDSVGPFVANHSQSGNNAPAYTAKVDYFFNTSSPVVAEDNGAEPDTWSPFIHTILPQAGANSLTITWYTDEPSIGAVDFGPTTAYGTTQVETVPSYFHSLTFSGLIAGNTYLYQIRSEDNLNQETTSQDFILVFDPEGPEIDIWYGDIQDFGQLGNPQELWINVFGNVSDPDGLGSLSYTLNGGGPVNLTIGPDTRRLENTGDFNVDLNWTTLNSGANTVVISATDVLGNLSTKTVTVNYTPGNVWPLPYTADWSTLTTDGDPLTPDPEIQTLAQVVDGKWSVDNGEIRTVEPGYDRLVALGDHLSDNYEALVPITIHSKSGGFGVGLLFRWNGHTTTPVSCTQPQCGYEPLGAIGWFRNNQLEFYQGVNQSFPLSTGTTYWMRMRVENNGSNPVYSLRVWEDGQTEPATWNLTQTEGPGTPQNGSLLLIAHEADASFGTVVITPIQGTPNLPPTADNDIATVVTGGTVNINVLSNDSDPDGTLAPSTVIIVAPPVNGTITGINLATGVITYDHNGSATSTDNFTYTVEDNDGALSNIATVNISIGSTPVLSFVSDDFCAGVLDPAWTFVDPQSDGTLQFSGANTSDAWVELSVPGGVEHQLWTAGIQAPHIIQAATNTDFELEVKFESPVNAAQYEEQGVLIKQDDFHFLRFEIYSTNAATFALAGVLSSATNTFPLSPSFPINQSIEPLNTAPIYMRVKRVGNLWTQSYSTDGVNFAIVGVPFTQILTVTGVGIYGGNGTGSSSPAHTAQIDYFENVLEDPITNEDNCSSSTFTLTYDGNTNNGGTAPTDGNSPYLANATVTVLGPGTLSKIGHSFAGWNTQGDGLGSSYAVASTFAITANTTLYAQWSSTPIQNFISDDFCGGVLDPAWTFVDPQADGTLQFTGANTSDAWVEILVPAGPEHQLWEDGIQAPHIIQPATDTDFELEVKFESPVNAPQYEQQGVLIKQDDFNFLRFEVYGTNASTYALSAILQPGPNTIPLNTSLPNNQLIVPLNTAPIYMRVKRVGNLWTQSYSTDGTNFTIVNVAFSHTLTVTGVGIYGGNGVGNGSPAHTAQFDYFENVLEDPITNEDNCSSSFTLTYDGNGNDGGLAPVDGNSPYALNAPVTVLAPGTLTKTGFSFKGWNTQADGLGTDQPVASTFNLTGNTTLFAQWTTMPCDTTNIAATTCNPAQVGVTDVTLTNQFGCDSLVITTTTLLPSDTTIIAATTCNPAQVGVTDVTLTNQFGCDSLVISTTTLLPSDTTIIAATTCDPAQVGVTDVTLTNQFGCDSLVITTTTLLPGDTTSVAATTCDPAQVGITQQVLTNQAGCDSIVFITTTLQPSDTTNVFATTCDPGLVGVTDVTLTNQFGCDSLVVTNTLLSTLSVSVSNVTCNNNGTPSFAGDDFLSFDLTLSGANLGPEFLVSGDLNSGPVITGSGTQSFISIPGTAGAGDLSILVTDLASGCTEAVIVSDPGTCSNGSNANVLTLELANRFVSPGYDVCVPVTVQNYDSIQTAQVTITWDPTILSLDSVSNFSTPGMDATDFVPFGTDKLLLLMVEDPTAYPFGFSLADGDTLFELCFTLLGQVGDVSPVSFINAPTPIEFSKATLGAPVVVPNALVDGSVTVVDPIPVTGATISWLGDTIGDVSYQMLYPIADNTVADSFEFVVPANQDGRIVADKRNDFDPDAGVTGLDVLFTQLHILNSFNFTTPYQLLAADVNQSGTITNIDIFFMENIILQNLSTYFPGSGIQADTTLWRIIPQDYVFPDPVNPWNAPNFRDVLNVQPPGPTGENFLGLKLGDVNFNWMPLSGGLREEVHGEVHMIAELPEQATPGATIKVPVSAKFFKDIASYSYTLTWDPAVLRFVNLHGKNHDPKFATHSVEKGALPLLWVQELAQGEHLPDGTVLYELEFEVVGNMGSEAQIEFGESITPMEAYTGSLLRYAVVSSGGSTQVGLQSTSISQNDIEGYRLIQNRPNPFSQSTEILFSVPEREEVKISIYNGIGQLVWEGTDTYLPGTHSVTWNRDNQYGHKVANGVYTLVLTAGRYEGTLRMSVQP